MYSLQAIVGIIIIDPDCREIGQPGYFPRLEGRNFEMNAVVDSTRLVVVNRGPRVGVARICCGEGIERRRDLVEREPGKPG